MRGFSRPRCRCSRRSGFRPVRAGRLFTENVPNPVRATVSPLARPSWNASNTSSTAAAASALDSDARLATRDTMSDLFNFHLPHPEMILYTPGHTHHPTPSQHHASRLTFDGSIEPFHRTTPTNRQSFQRPRSSRRRRAAVLRNVSPSPWSPPTLLAPPRARAWS